MQFEMIDNSVEYFGRVCQIFEKDLLFQYNANPQIKSKTQADSKSVILMYGFSFLFTSGF